MKSHSLDDNGEYEAQPYATMTMPRVLEHLSTDTFCSSIVEMTHRGGCPQLLLFTSESDKEQEASRNVVSNHASMCVTKLPPNFPLPQRGTETYVTSPDGYLTGGGGKAHSENKGMLDDWHGHRLAMNCLLSDDISLQILKKAFGEDFRLLPERGYYRNLAALDKDLRKNAEQLVVHKDDPKWIRSNTAKVEVVTAKCKAGQLAWVLIDQAEFHGLPTGGKCVGWFLSAVSPAGFQSYLAKVQNHLNRLRAGKLKHVNHDPVGHQEGFSALDSIIYDFCKGSRPHLYESGKTVQAPHSMAANKFTARQHRYLTRDAFENVRGGTEVGTIVEHSTSAAKAMRSLEERGLSSAFENAFGAGGWNVDPQTFSDESLVRFFDIVLKTGGQHERSKRQRLHQTG